MGLSIEQKANEAYNVLVNETYHSKLTDKQLDTLLFMLRTEVLERAITAGKYEVPEDYE